MSKTSFLQVTGVTEEAWFGALQSGDRFITPRIQAKSALLSQARVANISARSYLTLVKNAWAALSAGDKAAWKAADHHAHQHGWRCFLADRCQRIKLGLAGDATPSSFHNDLVGGIVIAAPAEEVLLVQPHPQSYWVLKKVSGTKSQYEPSLVTEGFGLPLVVSLNYKSDLVSTGAGSFARLFARVRHLYQGENLDYNLNVEMALSAGWSAGTATASSLLGQAISYNLYLHLFKVRGTLLFDNIKVQHSGSIWTRDQFCRDIDASFTRAFYQVPKNWGVVTLPAGASYGSIYPT